MTDDEQPALKTKTLGPSNATSQQPLPVYGLPMPLGKYTLVERLGVGGMAEVFLATQDGPAGFQKKHVIKRCLPHLAEDKRFVEMFLREARVASRLNHQNVVSVHELGHVGNTYFLVMEYVDGLTLRRLCERAWAHRKPIPTELIVHAIGDAALGLHHAHTLTTDDGKPVGLVHRDISPENLMIDKEGNTKVLDFGIARDTGSGKMTKTGELRGKIPFMSPEHIRGESLDGRSDIFALGVTLYWLLTGRRPHRARSELTLLNEILSATPEPPSVFNPNVPKDLDELCMAMLERDRELRPPTALAVHQALTQSAPTRSTVVAPFVRETLRLPERSDDPLSVDEADGDALTGAGFIPSTPRTSIVLTGWHRLDRVDTRGRLARVPVESSAKRHRLPVLLGAGAAALLGVVTLAVVAWPDAPPPPSEATRPDVPVTPSPVVASPVEMADPTPPHVPASVAPVTAPPADVAAPVEAPASARLQRVVLKAPAKIAWLLPKGASSAGGGTQLPVSVRAVKAMDQETRGVSLVPIERGVADYGKLGMATLDVRALPWAKVKIGKLDLGITPFPPRQLVEGTYDVRLEHEGKSEVRKVVLKAGRTERLIVDYLKK